MFVVIFTTIHSRVLFTFLLENDVFIFFTFVFFLTLFTPVSPNFLPPHITPSGAVCSTTPQSLFIRAVANLLWKSECCSTNFIKQIVKLRVVAILWQE